MSKFYRISGKVLFPEGLSAGEGREANVTDLARDGMGRFLLRGTSIAGTIRSALMDWGVPEESISFWFGDKKEIKNDIKASQIMVSDMLLETKNQSAEIRTHNKIDRNTGTVSDAALFDVELLPPGTKGQLLIYIMPRDNQPADNILQALQNAFANSLLVGGSKNRGVGRMDASAIECLAFDCDTLEGYSLWQDVRYADRAGLSIDMSGCEKIAFESKESIYSETFDVDLKIPEGEDIAIGYGKDVEGNLCAQQYVYDANGSKYWRIPGSTMRGVIRAWMTRLAILDGMGSENAEKFIQGLFGSLEQCGRIHFTDAFCHAEDGIYEQRRSHVAIDRFSGGVVPKALFSNKVLVGPGLFKMKITIKTPKAKELEWLKKSLLALHLGVISVGSSKASGLLEIDNWDTLKTDLENAISSVAC